MIVFISKNLGKIILIFLMAILILSQVSKSVGFCAAQTRFISDDEYIEMMLEHSYKHRIKLTPADTSVKTYIKNHPDCCRIETTSIFDLLDISARKVYLNYPVRAEVAQVYGIFYEEYLSISSCAKQFSESTGMGSHSPSANNY